MRENSGWCGIFSFSFHLISTPNTPDPGSRGLGVGRMLDFCQNLSGTGACMSLLVTSTAKMVLSPPPSSEESDRWTVPASYNLTGVFKLGTCTTLIKQSMSGGTHTHRKIQFPGRKNLALFVWKHRTLFFRTLFFRTLSSASFSTILWGKVMFRYLFYKERQGKKAFFSFGSLEETGKSC